ncbi:FAD/NAD(P)-binding domain-containing protein [Leucogyrophana mollusca]|uniref:FAD/NAD(P)-binding domain-containing protein n=1 Tax=Leucogyrophana mollusca TaxID=85980 RepID=A0ACB8BVL4_9AGAM|nr:FAD/NAD(P)-binding domain-containing protein [Leucogyrophana mollusca]
MSSPKFRVAISGAGIGGLVLALTIGKYSNLPIDLYEAQSEITTVGAGISIWRRTMEILEELGLSEDIAKVASRPTDPTHGFHFRKSDNPQGGLDWFHQAFSYGGSSMHRRDMMDMLENHLPSTCTVHFLKRLTTYTQQDSGGVNLCFSDGTTATADVLVGADGIRSPTRKVMFEDLASRDPAAIDIERLPDYVDPSWTGCLIYRSLVTTEKLKGVAPNHPAATEMMMAGPPEPSHNLSLTIIQACGKGKHVVSYPVSRGTLINVVGFVSDPQAAGKRFKGHWVTDVLEEELMRSFEDYEPQVQTLLQCCEKPSRWALHVVNELPLSTSGRVAIMGDACHAMTPHFGAGAGQAIEDAFVLGRLLAHELTTTDNLPAALRIYQDVRLPFSSWVARESLKTGDIYEFLLPGLYSGLDQSREKEDLDRLQRMIIKQWEWQGKDGSIAEWIAAEKRLMESFSRRFCKL